MQNVVYRSAPWPRQTDGEVAAGRPAGGVAVVIPCFRVIEQVCSVIAAIGPEVRAIYVIDDQCPLHSGRLVERTVRDPRVQVLYHDANQGVGGATMTGMRQALRDGAEIIVKIDGDGQMDPALLPLFIDSIRSGEADYAKGNRFFDPDALRGMPRMRLVGNAGLSFLAKLSSGYWHVFDPTNGYIAIHGKVARYLPFHKIDRRFFFESDLLFHLNILQAKVVDIPMAAVYGGEDSNLKVGQSIAPFLKGHLKNFLRRVFYNYFLRNFSIGSIELVLGVVLLLFGLVFGITNWSRDGVPATAGTVMLAGLPVIVGLQLLLAFLNFDIQSAPTTLLHQRLWPPDARTPAKAGVTPPLRVRAP